MKRIFLCGLLLFMFSGSAIYSQSFLQMLNQSLQQANQQMLQQIEVNNEVNRLNNIINNPSLQSADMQSYIAFLQAGVNAANQNNHADALSHYGECRKVISRTTDTTLKKLYNQYGWKDNLDKFYTQSYTQYKLQHPGEPLPGQVAPSTTSSGGSYSAPYTPTQHANHCGVCSSTGKCSNCNGTGISPYSKSICGACGGRGICVTCNGTGISGYSYY